VEYLHLTDPRFWAEIAGVSAEGVVLRLGGEVDVANQSDLDGAISAMVATNARRALIDASDCTFISLQAYAAIGRCSTEFDSLTLRTWLGVARTVLDLLGFEGVVCTPARASFDFSSMRLVRGPEMQPVGCGIPAVKALG
jgi:hypothetical protein